MLVSIIIPCYNVENYIRDCILSAVSQTYTTTEIICIDNTSTDKTWEILNSLQAEFPGLIIDKEKKPGASAARNKGLLLAKGEWIQFLDADDLLLPEKIGRQVALLEKNPNTILIAGSYYILTPDGKQSCFIVTPGNKWNKLIEGSLGCTISNLFKREVVARSGGWDEQQKSSQEFKLMFDIMKNFPAGKIIFDSTANVIYQKRGEGSISSNYKANIARFIELRQKIWNYLKQTQSEEVSENFYLNSIFQKLRILYTVDCEQAISFYKQNVPRYFVPSKSILTPAYYILLYKLLGFERTEKLIRKIKFK